MENMMTARRQANGSPDPISGKAGWMVEKCSSTEQDIQLLGGTALFSHRVATTVPTSWAGGREASDERETIVFVKTADGRILCVHEHLSVSPAEF
jgi:ketosteroid isomerase-like protein